MKKRVTVIASIIILVVIMAVCFTACGGGGAETSPSQPLRTFPIPSPTPKLTAPVTQDPGTSDATPTDPGTPPTDTGAQPTDTGAAPPSTGTTTPTGNSVAFINDADVNIRKDKSTSAEVLGKSTSNMKVSVLQKDAGDGWVKISYNSGEAYVSAPYITTINDITDTTAKINGDDINMRSKASTTSASLGTLKKDTQVKVIKKDAGNGWSLIDHDNKICYISTQLLTF